MKTLCLDARRTLEPVLLFCVLPHLPISRSEFFSFGEGVEDQTGYHTKETNKEAEMIGFSWVSMIDTRIEFDDSSQGRHEDSSTRHGKEIDPCHRCA